jgi:endoglucanase
MIYIVPPLMERARMSTRSRTFNTLLVATLFLTLISSSFCVIEISFSYSSNRITLPATGRIVAESIAKLHTEGRYVVDDSGRKVYLRGVNRPSLEWDVNGDRHHTDIDWANIKAWGCNLIRLPFAQDLWEQSESYRIVIDRCVNLSEQHGIYIIIDNHRSTYLGNQPYHYPTDWDTWLSMWEDISTRYKGRHHVLFGIYNELTDLNYTEWSGHAQDAYNTIRRNAPDNIVVIGALRTGGDLSWVVDHPVNGTNIIYDGHLYVYHDPMPDTIDGIKDYMDRSCGYKSVIDNNIAPVLIGEFNAFDRSEETWMRNFLKVLNEWELNYAAWAYVNYFESPGIDTNLVEDDWVIPTWKGQLLIESIREGGLGE